MPPSKRGPRVIGVSSVVRPVGEQPPAVYWRRRLLIVAVVAVVGLLLLRACGGSDATPVVDPSAAPTPTATEGSTATPTPTTSPKATTNASTTAGAVTACDPADVRVTATVADEQYPVGGPVPIRFVVTTTKKNDCVRDVGAAANTVTITSDDRRIWSSDDCTPGGDADLRRISESKPFAVTVTWQGDVSRPGCESPRPKAPAGTYDVRGRNGDITGPKDTFTLG